MKKIFGLLLICIAACPVVVAQADLHNTGIVFLNNNTDTLFINGNFANTSGAAFTNNGIVQVKQNLVNDQAGMAAGSGSLYLNGTNIQTVNGSQAFKTYHLFSNNNAGVTLNNDLSVSGVHNFMAGVISTSVTPHYMIYESGASFTGDGDDKHINGWVKKNGSTDFTFPVGDATFNRTAAISNLSGVSEVICRYYAPTQNIFNLFSPLVNVKANEYWQIDNLSGGTAQITLNWDHAKVPMNNVLLADILTGYYTGGKWTDAGGSGTASGAVNTTGNVSSGTVSSFGSFTFGFRSFPVPLRLISFTGERSAGTSFLYWVTENEQQVDHFDLQRSYEANVFTTIGKIPGRNTGSRQAYHFEDHAPLQGFALYRLRSTDADGRFSYSGIVVVTEKDAQHDFFTVLNPARLAVTIFNRARTEGRFEYRLFTAGGLLVLKGNTTMTINGGTVLPLPASSAPGMYLLELSNDKIHFRQMILIQK